MARYMGSNKWWKLVGLPLHTDVLESIDVERCWNHTKQFLFFKINMIFCWKDRLACGTGCDRETIDFFSRVKKKTFFCLVYQAVLNWINIFTILSANSVVLSRKSKTFAMFEIQKTQNSGWSIEIYSLANTRWDGKKTFLPSLMFRNSS